MTIIGVTQGVTADPRHGIRNDALDQRWHAFLAGCGLLAVPIPNQPAAARALTGRLPLAGLLLTGGNDLHAYGGCAPERDAVEDELVTFALRRRLPLLGVCRGMQVLQHRYGIPLTRVEGQVTGRQRLTVDGRDRTVNSYHHWAATRCHPPLRAWVTGPGGVVKAVRHQSAPLVGIMWHPERLDPFAAEDLELFRRHFKETS